MNLSFRIALLALCLFSAGCSKKKYYSGYIQQEEVMIAATTSGILESLDVYDGQWVEPGQILFQLDNVVMEKDLASALATLEAQEITYQTAYEDYLRAQRLWQERVISDAQWEKSGRDYITARTNLEIATLKVTQIRKQLQERQPTSPEPAYVQTHYYWPGAFVPQGSPIISLILPQQTQAIFFIPIQDRTQIFLGKKVLMQYNNHMTPLEGEVTYIAAVPQYTPPVIYSQNFDETLSYMVKAKIFHPDTEERFIPRLPIRVFFDE